MVAGGPARAAARTTPRRSPRWPSRCARCSRRRAVRSTPALALRIGIESGPVVAGVIGRRKFIYDLWGDTVNTASRMESHGIPGQIQVSEATHRRLRDRYAFESRGEIEVKGKGRRAAYLLIGRIESLRGLPRGPVQDGAPGPRGIP